MAKRNAKENQGCQVELNLKQVAGLQFLTLHQWPPNSTKMLRGLNLIAENISKSRLANLFSRRF
jgi:hypothetical protein